MGKQFLYQYPFNLNYFFTLKKVQAAQLSWLDSNTFYKQNKTKKITFHDYTDWYMQITDLFIYFTNSLDIYFLNMNSW